MKDQKHGVAPDDGFKATCAAAMKTVAEERLGVLHNDVPDFTGEGEVFVDKAGNTHVRLVNMLDGEPVVGGSLVMHIAADGTIKAVNGEIVKKPAAESFSAKGKMLRPMDALKTALRQQGLQGGEFVDTPELKWVRNPSTGEPCRAWMASYFYETPDGNYVKPHRDEIYADAWTGEVSKAPSICVIEQSCIHHHVRESHLTSLLPTIH